jgi:hypothetical protein
MMGPQPALDRAATLKGRPMPIGQLLLSALISSIPELLALITALVFVIAGKHRKPAVFVVIAMAIMVLLLFAWPFYREWVFQRSTKMGWYPDQMNGWFVGWQIFSRIIQIGALALMLIAAFGWRKGNMQNEHEQTPPTSAPAIGAGPGVKPISKGLYFSLIFGPSIVSLLLMIPAIAMLASGEEDLIPVAMGLFCALPLLMIVTIVTVAVLIYKMWSAIQGEPTPRSTPGKAVGFLFIPLFNLYWIFQAYWGWAQDYNRMIAARGIQAKPMSEGLTLTMCILNVCSVIPYLGILVSLANLPFVIIFLNGAMNGVNAIAATSPPADAEPLVGP